MKFFGVMFTLALAYVLAGFLTVMVNRKKLEGDRDLLPFVLMFWPIAVITWGAAYIAQQAMRAGSYLADSADHRRRERDIRLPRLHDIIASSLPTRPEDAAFLDLLDEFGAQCILYDTYEEGKSPFTGPQLLDRYVAARNAVVQHYRSARDGHLTGDTA